MEEVIYRHPGVSEVAVIPEYHRTHGEVPKAVVVLKEGHEMTARELVEHCKPHLANFKIPKKVEFVSELPKTAAGKILKRALVKRGERERGVN